MLINIFLKNLDSSRTMSVASCYKVVRRSTLKPLFLKVQVLFHMRLPPN